MPERLEANRRDAGKRVGKGEKRGYRSRGPSFVTPSSWLGRGSSGRPAGPPTKGTRGPATHLCRGWTVHASPLIRRTVCPQGPFEVYLRERARASKRASGRTGKRASGGPVVRAKWDRAENRRRWGSIQESTWTPSPSKVIHLTVIGASRVFIFFRYPVAPVARKSPSSPSVRDLSRSGGRRRRGRGRRIRRKRARAQEEEARGGSLAESGLWFARFAVS